MAERPSNSSRLSRHRAHRACEPCKHRKKRCDGTEPCATCVRYHYQCYFSPESRSRMLRTSRQPSSHQHNTRQSEVPVSSTNAPSRPAVDAERRQLVQSPEDVSRDAISYAASAGMVQSQLQVHHEHAPSDEQTSYPYPTGPSATGSAPVITSALSLEHMQQLATSFLENVHPLYTFIRPAAIRRSIIVKFSHSNAVHGNDTILFGIAVVGSLFGTNATTPSQDWHIELARNFEASIDADITRARSPQLELLASLVLKTIYNRLIARPYALWLTSLQHHEYHQYHGKRYPGHSRQWGVTGLVF